MNDVFERLKQRAVMRWHLDSSKPKHQMREATRQKRAKALNAAARACLFSNARAYRDPALVMPYWDSDPFGPSRTDLRLMGGRKAVMKRIEQLDFDCGRKIDFNAEFIFGLKVAGALSNRAREKYRIYIHKHVATPLLEDLKLLGVPFRAATSAVGHLRITRSPFLFWQNCCSGRGTPSTLAGVFASAKICRIACEAWLKLPVNCLVEAYLRGQEFAIPLQKTADGKHFLVSPFYAFLLSPYMPLHLGNRILNITKPIAQCPLLPVVFWEWLESTRRGYRTIPAATALPCGCAHSTYYHLGYNHSDLIHRGRQELGLRYIGSEMRRIAQDWVDTYFSLAGNGEVSHEAIRDILKAKYFPIPSSAAPANVPATITSENNDSQR